MDNKFLNKFTSLLFYLSILVFIIAFNFAHNPPGGWYQQFMPSTLPNIIDITFTDSLTGYAVTGVSSDSNSYIIKTTNGGDNWNVIFQDSSGREFTKIKFLNNNIGFTCTKWFSGSAKLFKTTDGGNFWFALNNPVSEPSYLDLSVLSEEELWCTDNIAFDGGVFRTTNGGVNWQRKYYDMSHGADRIYMINSRIGFISNGQNSNNYLRKTTDSGNSWTLLSEYGYSNIFFEDSLKGWKSGFSQQNFRKTTNGGIDWITILSSQSGNPNVGIVDFKILNDSTIWGVNFDSYILFPNNQFRGVIFKTTNSGITWGYQLPDTSINIFRYFFIKFSDFRNGWGYPRRINNVHTTAGGDSITYPLTSINNQGIVILEDYKLFQNYPNPFNPKTKIEYEIHLAKNIMVKVFGIQGKEMRTLIDKSQSAGKYMIEFDGSGLPSGVYFYSLFVNNLNVATRKMLLIK